MFGGYVHCLPGIWECFRTQCDWPVKLTVWSYNLYFTYLTNTVDGWNPATSNSLYSMSHFFDRVIIFMMINIMSTGVGFYSNSTVPIQFWKLSTQKRFYRNIKRYPYPLTPSKWECCTWNQAPLKLGHLLHICKSSLGRPSGSTSFSNIPESLTRNNWIGGSIEDHFQMDCWACRYKSGLEMCLNPWHEVDFCVESSKMLARDMNWRSFWLSLVPRSRVQKASKKHLWEKHKTRWREGRGVTPDECHGLKVQICGSCCFFATITNLTMSHVVLGVFQNSATSVGFVFVWIFFGPWAGVVVNMPSFKRNWFVLSLLFLLYISHSIL